LLGDGKTYQGFFIGVAGGLLIGILQITFQQAFPAIPLPPHTLLSVFLLALGALTGDLIKSFFKRRMGKGRGERWPIADQYDLVAGAFLFLALFDLPWLLKEIIPFRLLVILIITPILHRVVNLVGYRGGWKDVPW
jgi:CDP-2,3-bis-(O-geranylgeranyl)-sn-glycerol synthase